MDQRPENVITGDQGFISGGGALGQLIREFDWRQTPLGPVAMWPQSLRSALSICLNSNFPIAIYWGKDLHLFYNDAWSPIPGNKHPQALGRTAKEVWPEIWPQIEPQFALAFSGKPGGSRNALLPMQRHGYTEECYFDFTFTPIYGEAGAVEGIFNAVIETTYQLINERRAVFLKQLSVELSKADTVMDVYRLAAALLNTIPEDIPFTGFFCGQETDTIQLLFASDELLKSAGLEKTLPFKQSGKTAGPVLLGRLNDYLAAIPAGIWPEPPRTGVLVPLQNRTEQGDVYLFCGLSPRLHYNEEYKLFIRNVAGAIDAVVATIASLETERRRAAALAEIDRSKTVFFANISHEFRTPITLLLGPVEDMLINPQLDADIRTGLEVVHRNALRMQKLVNNLLDFSKIEAGRARAAFQPVDLCDLTAGLTGMFRSAIEKAGMKLRMNLQPVHKEVYLDVDMWEQIIMNLMSNAFKYSLEGSITVSVIPAGKTVDVVIADTGIGIAEDQIDKLFNRFHRIDNVHGRSQEGTGIGLAMVRELVNLLQATIRVTSAPGMGSVFTITLLTGKDHLPPDQFVSAASDSGLTQAAAYINEAMQWISPEQSLMPAPVTHRLHPDRSIRQTVLIADDNKDMRTYAERLLRDQFEVITATDGHDAFDKMLRHKPDLLISDIMMPGLDGFGLLKKVRSHPDLKSVPVIFLSARAGEEAKVEGLNAGADDYLVKPFSAKELIVRVVNHIRINQIRQETEQQFYHLFLQAPAIINVFKGAGHIYEFFHPLNKKIFGDVDFTGLSVREALPELEDQGIFELLDEVYQTGNTVHQAERPVTFITQQGRQEIRYLNFIYQPWYNLKGEIQGVLNFAVDVTDQAEAQQVVEQSIENLQNIFAQAPVAMALFRGKEQRVDIVNERMLSFWGKDREQVLNKSVFDGLPEIKGQGFEEILNHVYQTGEPYSALEWPVSLMRNDKLETAYVNFGYEALREKDGSISGIMAVAAEVTEQVLARKKTEEAEVKARLAIESADSGTYEVNLLTGELSGSPRFYAIWGFPEKATRQQLIDTIHPEDRCTRDKAYQDMAHTGKLYYEVRIRSGEQAERWIRITGRQVNDLHGIPSLLLGVAQDITEQKEFFALLTHQVRQRTQELEQSNDDLRQFAHVASHDLREPVRKIKLFSHRLTDEYGYLLPQKGQEFIRKIQRSADRMNMMISGVLTYSSFNELPKTKDRIDLNLMISQIETDLEVLIQEKHARIIISPLPQIEGVTIWIYQLFYNLINNSLKFTFENRPPVIEIAEVTEKNNPDFIRISVTDNGIGFDQQYASSVFETFKRLHAKDAYEGTGLGLALCKKIAERHGGKIIAESSTNQGCTFTVWLPAGLQ